MLEINRNDDTQARVDDTLTTLRNQEQERDDLMVQYNDGRYSLDLHLLQNERDINRTKDQLNDLVNILLVEETDYREEV